ncbi:heavy metal translocating P-type ATPase [Paracoccus aminophilus]|uniref:P-type Zn(2+) transporter n=1 Tax=Paracoccus aminophilus JCM 7686 TaxID=1367847 RepID=S5Z0G8_PARAH|nr:heavy metal translocating P-type ATPase [Paracoccus aminophilus]AGT10961.1 heavy metal-(Cd/Co/Hg/Pb/Zn)-translocating P-type ATPase [Paracoccus aminophilus JCM 7686]
MTAANQRQEWTVTGMDCASCTVKITRAVERMPGVSQVQIALMAEKLSLDLDKGQTAPEVIEEVVRKLGFGIARKGEVAPRKKAFVLPDAAPAGWQGHDHGHDHAHGHDHDHSHDHAATAEAAPGLAAPNLATRPAELSWYRKPKGRLVLFTAALLALAWAVELIAGAGAGHWAFVLASLIGVAPVARRAYEATRFGQPFTIEALMTIAALGALAIGAAEEAALVVFLFAVGELLEGVAANKARAGIRALADLVPKTALVERGGTLLEVPAETLDLGEIVLVRPGERIPADGEIVEGVSGIDESPVSGESVPRVKAPGEAVFAGSVNLEAALRLKVTRAASDNTISRIIRLVEEAEEARAPTERFIDRFSRWYMPFVVLLSALVIVVPPLAFGADWQVWIYRGLALLLIGCPCALVISVPASIASALSSGARRGLLMKGGAVIEAAASVTQIAFDKTGTLTEGQPQVVRLLAPVAAGGGLSPEVEAELLATAAGVETGSNHPLAQAILRRAEAAGIAALPASGARALPGKGATALVAGAPAYVASPREAEAAGVLTPADRAAAAAIEAEGATVVAVYRPERLIGLIGLRDEPRADAAPAMARLREMGIRATMLTGDNPRTAQAIAGALGLEARAEMMPEDKLTAIREMSAAGPVMMIGDGINDAPALKQAAVGVAMGSGTDVALETADAAILRDRVGDAAELIALSRRTMGNIRQNVGIALGLKSVFLVTSVLGMTGLWLAILADTGATVLVTLNALRLLRLPRGEG